jgi:hypothetical protein
MDRRTVGGTALPGEIFERIAHGERAEGGIETCVDVVAFHIVDDPAVLE